MVEHCENYCHLYECANLQNSIKTQYEKINKKRDELIELQREWIHDFLNYKNSHEGKLVDNKQTNLGVRETVSRNSGETEDHWCFIGGITRNAEYRDLKYFLEHYIGKIKRVDVVKSKACAFVEFYEESSYQLAINMRAIKYRNKFLRIEKRMNPNNKGKERQH
ncbi:14572_t:CDS:2 [Acaulospora morrowiae]|uniref:14572_t:CDS:1 n=1 Tax=Acaulospora morrowiae TaxID=94023 RepID=A0A9N8ZUZ9_9GLOM|nr:14572_t:CDS:2 [Acaulospora morrowiae]